MPPFFLFGTDGRIRTRTRSFGRCYPSFEDWCATVTLHRYFFSLYYNYTESLLLCQGFEIKKEQYETTLDILMAENVGLEPTQGKSPYWWFSKPRPYQLGLIFHIAS